MSSHVYIMRDQARDTVARIMRDPAPSLLVRRPSWLAFTLLLVAFNILAVSSA